MYGRESFHYFIHNNNLRGPREGWDGPAHLYSCLSLSLVLLLPSFLRSFSFLPSSCRISGQWVPPQEIWMPGRVRSVPWVELKQNTNSLLPTDVSAETKLRVSVFWDNAEHPHCCCSYKRKQMMKGISCPHFSDSYSTAVLIFLLHLLILFSLLVLFLLFLLLLPV